MNRLALFALLLLSGCACNPRQVLKSSDGNMYLNGPAYADYMDVSYEYAFLFAPPFQYELEVNTTTNGYRISAEGLMRYGVMSGWRAERLRSK